MSLSDSENNRPDQPENSENQEVKIDSESGDSLHAPEDHHPDEAETVSEDHQEEVAEPTDHTDDLATLNPEEWLEALKMAIVDPANRAMRDRAEDLKARIQRFLDDERNEKLKAFVEAGGAEMDFHLVQPLRSAFHDAWKTYRTKRNQYFKEVKQGLEENLSVKQALIEELKKLLNKEESLQETINEFREIQNKWRQTGPVPRTHADELWRTYHFHVENFYDYLRLNKDFRELDFKKNLELKQEIVEKAGALAEAAQTDLRQALKELNDLHRAWKEIGPVDREHRDTLWDAFQEKTKAIYQLRDQHFQDLRDQALERLEAKKKVVADAMAHLAQDLKSHGEWQRAMKTMDGLFEQFKSIGRVQLPENDVVWEQFRSISRDFNHRKNAFYKDLKNFQQENLRKKRALIDRAKSLMESDTWRETARELKVIQEEWKTIGQVPRQESDAIWNEFREACNHFFNRLKGENQVRDAAQETHFASKSALLEELKAYQPEANESQKAVDDLKGFINRWRGLGSVPREKRAIETAFDKLIDEKFAGLRMDLKESAMIRFENRVHTLATDPRELDREEDTLRRKLEDLRKEMMQLENNILFLSSSSSKESPIVVGVRKNIEKLARQVELLEDKIKLLRKQRREMDSRG
jgi:hypothetical protein